MKEQLLHSHDCYFAFKSFFESHFKVISPWRLHPLEVFLTEMTVLKFEVLKLNCEPTEFSFVSNSWQCILRLMCYATCMQPNCTNITGTGVFHEIIINVMFVRLQKTFSFLNTLQGSLDTMLLSICRSRPFHTYQ